MTITVEDGSLVSAANSYITVDEYRDWSSARFGPRSTEKGCDEDIEALILRATDYFESQPFIGLKVTRDQTMQWPRQSVTIDGYYVDADSIPSEVKNSIYELAYAEEIGEGELNTVDREVTSETVGPISVTYRENASARNLNVSTSKAMRKLLAGGGGLMVMRA